MNVPEIEVHSSERQIFYVAVCSMITSIVMFFSAIRYIYHVKNHDLSCTTDIVVGGNFFISLVVLCMSAYQFALSVILYTVTRKPKNRPSLLTLPTSNTVHLTYVITVWYISHLSIMPMYWALYILEITVAIRSRKCILAVCATVIVFGYQAIFTCFVVIVYRFLKRNGLI